MKTRAKLGHENESKIRAEDKTKLGQRTRAKLGHEDEGQ